MESNDTVFNSVNFSPNPWTPFNTPYFKPSKPRKLHPKEENETLNAHLCRLISLFPEFRTNHLLKVLKLNHCNFIKALDTLLFIKHIQNQNKNLSKYTFSRKSTCARCFPIKRKMVLQRILEEGPSNENRTVFPNITFGKNGTFVAYDHNLNLQLPSPKKIKGQDASQDEIIDVENTTAFEPSSPKGIKLKVLRHMNGEYKSQLM